MDSELKDMLNALLEGQRVTNAKLEALASDIVEIKEQVADISARVRFLTHKTAELEEDLFVVKHRQRA